MPSIEISEVEKQGQRSREDVIAALPWLSPLVDMWIDHLEFWDTSGGLDNATQEEMDAVHETVKVEAERLIQENFPNDLPIANAYTNLTLHTAIGIRRAVLSTEPGDAL